MPRPNLQPHPLELAIQRFPLDPQHFRRATLVAIGRRDHATDLLRFRIGQLSLAWSRESI